MGIINETAEFMCQAKNNGVSFQRTLMLGRQNLYLGVRQLVELARRFRVPNPDLLKVKNHFSEEFFRQFLMAEEITSLDYSDYQGADIKHDMNRPIPEHLEDKYNVVVDGGTLEHVFNFPIAISNCMKMVKSDGGRLFIFTPANNQMGHGFYQFSPELFFRTLCASNGFEVERMVAVEFKHMAAEFGSYKKQFEVKDPDLIRARVTLENSHPVGLMIQAKKTSHVSRLFEQAPQQSDYQVIWKGDANGQTDSVGDSRSLLHQLADRLPSPIRRALALKYHKYFTHSFRNSSSYVPRINKSE